VSVVGNGLVVPCISQLHCIKLGYAREAFLFFFYLISFASVQYRYINFLI
jgi:hypothetical protein